MKQCNIIIISTLYCFIIQLMKHFYLAYVSVVKFHKIYRETIQVLAGTGVSLFRQNAHRPREAPRGGKVSG